MYDIKYDFIGHYETMEEDLADLVTGCKTFYSIQAYQHIVSDISLSLLNYYSQTPIEWINILG